MIRALHSGLRKSARGSVTIEWILVTVVLIVPFALFTYAIARLIAGYFTRLSWTLLLPFP